MSETKFTPGPWVYEEFIGKYENELGEIVTTKEKRSNIHIGNETVIIVGDSGVWSPKISEEVSNMKLIAAAPDLYHALDDLVSILELDTRSHVFDVVCSARAALAKARGE